jgi:type IV pilus assembly protein PilB
MASPQQPGANTALKLTEILLQEGLVTREQLQKALDAQKRFPEQQIGALLIKEGAVSDKDLALALSKMLNIAYAPKDSDLLMPAADQNLNKLVTEEFCRKNHLLPLFRHANALTVAMADPTNVLVLDNLRLITGCYIHRLVASYADIENNIGLLYGQGGSQLKSVVEASYKDRASEVVVKKDASDSRLTLDTLVASAEKAPVINLTDLLILQAVKDRASDIHMEPFEDHISIRFRIDGVLYEMPPPDKSMFLPLISRLKIISKMDISEKRLPQDGSFSASIEGRDIDFRVSTIPTIHGEKMVLRILDKRATSMSLEKMGMNAEELAKFRKYINKPYGLVLVTGPTGSGKTTTLYSVIAELKGTDKNITTVEDPVEYQISGINQVNVKPQIGLTFASGLRAFLRQDPDIMLVGEIRDLETAQICVRAALTGHMVFSTLHTNDAPSTLNRLMDIGVEPFFVSSSLQMVVAQRLIRRLCDKCKESYKPAANQLPANFKMTVNALYRAKGCDRCSKTGYAGRMAIFEILYMTEIIQEMIIHHASSHEIKNEAVKNGMKTVEQSGFEQINLGATSIEEVLRITMAGGY